MNIEYFSGYSAHTILQVFYATDRSITLFLSNQEMDDIMKELKQLFKIDKVPIRPNRKYDRNTDKYRKREKPKCFKNKKNADMKGLNLMALTARNNNELMKQSQYRRDVVRYVSTT